MLHNVNMKTDKWPNLDLNLSHLTLSPVHNFNEWRNISSMKSKLFYI